MSITIPVNQARQLAKLARRAARNGWCPATGGNFSIKYSKNKILITASGVEKGKIGRDDLLVIGADAEVRLAPKNRKPSAETLLHTAIYALNPSTQGVFHAHSPAIVSWSLFLLDSWRRFKENPFSVPESMKAHFRLTYDINGLLGWLRVSDHELVKIWPGVTSHEQTIEIPVFENSQNMPDLAAIISENFGNFTVPIYILAGHGAYAWSESLLQAYRYFEALETILDYERLRLSYRLD